jgi:hypothetical protein
MLPVVPAVSDVQDCKAQSVVQQHTQTQQQQQQQQNAAAWRLGVLDTSIAARQLQSR